MYDLHSHILYGVDDGPQNIDDSIKMAEILHKQGIRNIVLTSHLNHPIEFTGNNKYDEIFDEFKIKLNNLFPDINIYKGAEIYISRNKLKEINGLPLRTINDTSYVLIEFSRDIKLNEIDKAIYELKHIGLSPIIAHIEQYRCIENELEAIIQLRNDGIVIQCNASSFFAKDKQMRKNVRKLMENGLVDIVATDFHGVINSPVEFNKTYKWIKKKYGKEIAKNIFEINPQNILNDIKISIISFKKYRVNRNKNKTILAIASTLILIFSVLYLNNSQSIIAVTKPVSALNNYESNTENYIENDSIIEKDTSIQIMDSISIESSESNIETRIILETEISNSEVVIASTRTEEEEFINNYVVYFQNLENKYVVTVDEYYLRLKNAIEIVNDEEKKNEVNSLLDELSNIEVESDNEIYKSLYDMQNDLEEKRYDVGIVQDIREHYLNKKIEVSNKYRIELEKYSQ